MKSTRFHHEICRISWIVDFLPLNPVFFIRTNTDIHERTRSTMKSARFHGHEICQILPIHEIRRISCICQMSQGPMVLFFKLEMLISHFAANRIVHFIKMFQVLLLFGAKILCEILLWQNLQWFSPLSWLLNYSSKNVSLNCFWSTQLFA